MKYMKKIILLLCVLVAVSHIVSAADTQKEIHWISFEEAEARMKQQPKKVIIDVYTGWCGWCKVMDRKTYANDSLIRYVNEHYYAIKFDAEQRTPVKFMGKTWNYSQQNKVNDLAVELMRGRMSYPTTIFMDEGFTNAQPMPGYLEVFQMESILKYLGGDHHKSMPWTDWQHNFKAQWMAAK